MGRIRLISILILLVATPAVNAAVFDCTSGDVNCLIAAINTANGNGEADTINLAAGSYTLTTVNNDTDGANGLPSLTSEISINGNGATVERDANAPAFRIFHISETAVVSMHRITIRGGKTVGQTSINSGAGIRSSGSLELADCTVSENEAQSENRAQVGFAGGVYSAGGDVTLAGCDISNNIGDGILGAYGAISDSTISHNFGSGIFGGFDLTVANSTVSQNAGVGISGIYMRITDCTISDNMGGGVEEGDWGYLTNCTISNNAGSQLSLGTGGNVINCTILGNGASDAVGIETGDFRGTAELVNTIIANNPGGNCRCSVGCDSFGHNLADDDTCQLTASTDMPNTDPRLGPFQDTGVPGGGHLPLLPDSPAIDAGDNANCTPLDQIGKARVDGDEDGVVVCDIGAVEFQGTPPPVGGSVAGIIPQSIRCQNRETGQRVTVPLPDDGAWNCEAAGLLFEPGDRIGQRVTGIADGTGPVGGTAAGVRTSSALCNNRSTGERVSIDLNGDKAWDCENAGLEVRTGDRIVQTVKGTAEQTAPPPDVLTVAIDIEPGDANNRINLSRDSAVSVSILTGNGFDALDVDPATVRFGPDQAPAIRYRAEDSDGDGDIDQRLRFRLQAG